MSKIDKLRAAWHATRDEKIPPEIEEDKDGYAWGPKAQAWFDGKWKRRQLAEEAFQQELGKCLAARGVYLKADGCGCCDSPRVTLFIDDRFVCDEENFYLDNLDGREVPDDD